MRTILIIDDNQDYRLNLLEIFQIESYSTLEARNGLIGLRMIYQHVPDIILCDIDMPVMTGLEVLETVKADIKLSSIPFILNTAHSDDTTRKTAVELGVDLFLIKGIPLEQLLNTISSFFDPSIL
ncbi:MAG: response regulator [Chloroflexota bacterium]